MPTDHLRKLRVQAPHLPLIWPQLLPIRSANQEAANLSNRGSEIYEEGSLAEPHKVLLLHLLKPPALPQPCLQVVIEFASGRLSSAPVVCVSSLQALSDVSKLQPAMKLRGGKPKRIPDRQGRSSPNQRTSDGDKLGSPQREGGTGGDRRRSQVEVREVSVKSSTSPVPQEL